MSNVLVTGGCGYKGHVLVPKLLKAGHTVRIVDTLWFGNYLTPHGKLSIIEGSILSPEAIDMDDVDTIIHLASVANDPCGDLNPTLTWETNALATMRLADRAWRAGVRQFIYASSGSVYGIKEEENVIEELEANPVSAYNETKMVSERALLSYADDMAIQIIRPATVCGLSPRMRLDVSVNLLTMAALTKGEITVFGGAQVRPNIHIDDITDVYLFFLSRPDQTGVFNAGFENLSIREIAEMVAEVVNVPITTTPSSDPRSYRMNADKLLACGFAPKKTVSDAIAEIVAAHRAGSLSDEPNWHNLNWMQQKGLA